jgi:TetR/AcrR family transcriptional regulator, transcriptional repressor for nem operon
MARPQEFETSKALRSAMNVFWLKGFEATSLADILAATGLSKSSLYATFGDKRSLFLAAFKAYQQERLKHLSAILNNDQPIRQSIETFFYQMVDNNRDASHGCGCMTANEAVELAPHDQDVRQIVSEDFRAVEDLFTQAIALGQKNGSITSRQEPRVLARFLVVSLQGLHVMVRAQADRTLLNESIEVIMAALD